MALALIEHAAGRVDELSLQALSLARDVAGDTPVEALLAGPGAREAAAQLGAHGVARAYVAEDERLETYAPEAWAHCVTELRRAAAAERRRRRGHEPRQRGARPRRRAARPAVRRQLTGILPGEPLTVTRVRWGGSLVEEARVHGSLRS